MTRPDHSLIGRALGDPAVERGEFVASGVDMVERMRTDVPSGAGEFGVVRLAAVGDLHLAPERVGRFRPTLLEVHRHADVLLLAGDLTERASAAYAACLAGEVRDLGLPVVAVLGNPSAVAARRRGERVDELP
jgi:3',5'-cyclic AMP phosphodiesterase CpdA